MEAMIGRSIAARGTRWRSARAFTLVEAMIAGLIVSLMFLVTFASLTVATRTVDPPSEVRRALEIRAALERIQADLEDATSVGARSAVGITISVPDRSADGSSDTIAYRFVAADGGVIERSVGGGAAEPLIKGITTCEFTTFERSVPSIPVIRAQTTETILVASPAHGAGSTAPITLLSGRALVTSVVLPTAAVRWRVTGLRVRGSRGSATSSEVTFALRNVTGGAPGSTVYASADVAGSKFPRDPDWVTIDIADFELDAQVTSLALTVTTASVLAPINLETTTIANATPWDTFFSGTLGAWISLGLLDLSYEIIGTVTLPESSVVTPPTHVHVRFTASDLPGQTFDTMATLEKRP